VTPKVRNYSINQSRRFARPSCAFCPGVDRAAETRYNQLPLLSRRPRTSKRHRVYCGDMGRAPWVCGPRVHDEAHPKHMSTISDRGGIEVTTAGPWQGNTCQTRCTANGGTLARSLVAVLRAPECRSFLRESPTAQSQYARSSSTASMRLRFVCANRDDVARAPSTTRRAPPASGSSRVEKPPTPPAAERWPVRLRQASRRSR